ncbi:MAG: hypothetical protein QM706_01975 [Nitrospira sp.]
MKLKTMGSVWLFMMLFSLTAAASVELTAFADKPFCEKVAALVGEQLDLKDELSKTVAWEAVPLKGQGPPTRRCSSLDQALMDLDNDGQQDLVVKTTFCLKRAPSDSLYVFPADSTVLDQASWQDLSLLLATPNKFERTGGTYPLTSLQIGKIQPPPALSISFELQPFVLDGVAYVGLTDSVREWMVIAAYRGGERFEDLCYLHRKKL